MERQRGDHMRCLFVVSLSLATAVAACERDRASSGRVAATLPSTDTVVPAVVLFVAGFDEDGIVNRRVPLDSTPGPYVVAQDIYADARGLAAVLAPESRVASNAGRLTIDGRETGIDARTHGSAAYVSVRKLARELRGYAHFGPGGRDATLWPATRLCEYFLRADTRADVYRGAAAEGLFAQCSR
jgi:hypothetical protein